VLVDEHTHIRRAGLALTACEVMEMDVAPPTKPCSKTPTFMAVRPPKGASILRSRPRRATVVAYLALFLALGGGACAMRRTSPPQIRACYSITTGTLRVRRSAHCARGEHVLVWNERGIAGTQSPQGTPGPAGTIDTSTFYTKPQSDARYLPIGGVAANSSALAGQAPSAFAPSSLSGSATSMSAGGSGDPYCMLGEIKLTATVGASLPTNWVLAQGQALPISSNIPLFSLVGTTYAGNGVTTFNLPDLRGAVPKGASPSGVNYAICVTGVFP
jgi:Phage Tail Collar Domain